MKQFIAVALAAVATAIDYPGDYCCTLYGDWYLSTSSGSKTICISPETGDAGQWFNLATEGFDNLMYSYWCGSYVYAEFGWGYEGDYRAQDYGFTSAGNVKNGDVYLQGSISSVWMKPYDDIYQGAVTLFEYADCTGQSGAFFAHENPDYAKQYSEGDMWEGNMWSTWNVAARIPYGYAVDFEATGGGSKKTIQGLPSVDFGEYMESQCQVIDNPAGKITVRRSELIGPVQCGWSGMTASSTMEFQISAGMSSSNGESTSETNQHTMDYQLSAGISMGDVSLGATGGESWTDTITQNIQSSYSQDTSTTVSFKCEGDDGVGLWQFYCDSFAGDISVFTLNTVCRYGQLSNQPPQCPWNACSNADCSECFEGWEGDQGLALASVAEQAHAEEESNSSIYAGAAFGVIGIIAAGALINNCNKKRSAIQEPLL